MADPRSEIGRHGVEIGTDPASLDPRRRHSVAVDHA
jgi:hypothetical protein